MSVWHHLNPSNSRDTRPLIHLIVFLVTLVGLLKADGALCAEPPPGWRPVLGRWEITEGEMGISATQGGGSTNRDGQNTGAIVLIGQPGWRDYRVGLRHVGGSDVFHLLLRGRNDRNCIQFGRDGAYYTLSVFKDGAATLKAKVQTDRPAGPESLAAEIRGNAFKGYRNGALIIEHTFNPSEIQKNGKAGIQSNHEGRLMFDQWVSEVFQTIETKSAPDQIEIQSVRLSDNTCGRQRLLVQVRDKAGVDDVLAAWCDATVGQGTVLPLNALRLERRKSNTVGVWETSFFSLTEGVHRLKVTVYDGNDQACEKTVNINLAARAGTFVTVGGNKIFENIDPHPVWRRLALEDPAIGGKKISNYLWDVEWGPSQIHCRALTIESDQVNKPYIGRKIVPDDCTLTIRPRLRTDDGKELTGPITRRLGQPTTMFGIAPMYEMTTPAGQLTWGVRVLNGDPILRFGATFVPTTNLKVTCDYVVENHYSSCEPLGTGENFLAWRPGGRTEGPVFTWAFNRRQKNDNSGFSFAPARLTRGQAYELPMLALVVLDAHTKYNKLKNVAGLAAKFAQLALAVPRLDSSWQDLATNPGQCRLALDRGYDFQENDWGIRDAGQFMALPWCAGAKQASGEFHTAFGQRPYIITKEKRVVLDLPLPELSSEKLTPCYEPLRGDWLYRSQECIDYISTQQNDDGTFRGHERMDHYWLARMTLGLLQAYRGFEGHPETQLKITVMVRKALARMMGEEQIILHQESTLRKQFGSGIEQITWKKGTTYQPFVYSPRWNVFTEMGGLVDQNLGHAHLFFTLLLYGTYVDPSYVTRPDIRSKIEEMIKFQWLSQDWNGDIWRVYVGGGDAAGGGDGFEEDLAMVLPRLATMAGLTQPWCNLAVRISAMKYGALRHFDYLPVANEWGYEFLTPIHHPLDWMPEGGWNRSYLGDVWLTGPAVCSGVYGPWYTQNIYQPIPDVFSHIWYGLLEEQRDVIFADDRHWLTIGGFCSESQLIDPFLGAVKLMRALNIAVKRDYMTKNTYGDALWNFAFYPAAMTLIQHELWARHPFMKDAQPMANAAMSSQPELAPAYAWKLPAGAVVSVAAQGIKAAMTATISVNGEKLGLSKSEWELTDVKTGSKRRVAAGQPLQIEIAPRSATTLRITNISE